MDNNCNETIKFYYWEPMTSRLIFFSTVHRVTRKDLKFLNNEIKIRNKKF